MADPLNRDAEHELLVIAPHADDAELFCGGLLAKMAKAGYRTAVVDLSEAELSTYGTPQLRKEETERASKVLALSYRTNLRLPNCRFHEHSGSEDAHESSAAGRITREIRTVRPDVLAVPYWQDRHPDHIEAARLCTRAIFLGGLTRYDMEGPPPWTPRLVIRYAFRFDFEPSFIVDISDVAERKLQAIQCYESQLRPPDGGVPTTVLASPLSLRSIQARDAYMGARIGVEYGEGYLSQAAVRIDDPVQHCRRWPTAGALVFRGEVQ